MSKSSIVLRKKEGNFITRKHKVGAVRLLVELLLCITELLKTTTKLKLIICWKLLF